MEKAIIAGGCFWCTEAIFQRLKGVQQVKSGFSGGHIKNPAYREVITQRTGHAEAIEITFDSNQISYLKLLEVFFATHNPTSLNQQGADIGTHYRSAIFYTSEFQKTTALNFIKKLTETKIFDSPIVTEITNFEAFYEAESYHTNYYNLNNTQSYCQFVITPKIEKLTTYFSDLLKNV